MKFNSRKFIAWSVITAFICVSLWAGKLTESGFQTLLLFLVPIYFGANIADKFAEKKINKE